VPARTPGLIACDGHDHCSKALGGVAAIGGQENLSVADINGFCQKEAMASGIRLSKLSIAAGLVAQSSLGSAWAAEECGPPSAGIEPEVICSGEPGLYASGISYLEPSIPHGLWLTLDSTVTVLRAAGPANHGVDLATNGPNAIRLDLADGVRISVAGVHAQGVKLKGRSDLTVDSGANIDVTDPSATADGHSTHAIVAEIDDPSATGNVVINQRAGSRLTVSGVESGGIGAFHEGQGSILVTTAGEIDVTTDGGSGVIAWGLTRPGASQPSAADVKVVQTGTGSISVDGNGASGVYALNDGTGHAEIEIDGSVTARGTGASGLLSVVNNPDSQARSTASVSSTGRVHAEGSAAYAVNAVTIGKGEVGVVSAGQVTAEGDGARGVSITATHVDHDAPAYAVIQRGGVRASGERARGIVVESAGSGQLSAVVASGAKVEASGTDAIGVQVTGLASGGLSRRARVAAQIGARVAAEGAYGVGVAITTDDDTASLLVASNGRVVGGWQADAASRSGVHGFSAAGVALHSNVSASLRNEGRIGAGSDRAVVDSGRYTGGIGNLTLENRGMITGFMELAPGGKNDVFNQAGGEFVFRHFADTDGDGVRDTKRVAVSDFGSATSRFANQAGGSVRLGSVQGARTVDATGFYRPTTGVDNRALPADVYDMTRDGIVQGQLLNLGEFNHAGLIDLRGAEIGNMLLITGAGAAALGPGTGTFVSDGGTLRLRVGARSAGAANPADRYADMLIVDATRLGGNGATRIQVDYDPAEMGQLTRGNGVELVEVRNESASVPGAFALGNRVAAGAYEYALHHGGVGEDAGDGNWYLRSFLRVGPEPAGRPAEEVPHYRKEVPVSMAVPALAHRLGLDVIGSYHDRAGEDHVVPSAKAAGRHDSRPDDDRRAWGRVFGSSGKVAGGGDSGLSRFQWFEDNGPRYRFDVWGIQIGQDLYRRMDGEGSRDVAGTYFAASRATARVDAVLGGSAGKVSLNGYTLGAYWTHVRETGSYIDAVAQVTRYAAARARSVAGEEIASDGWGATASLETGYPLGLSEGWHIEPQAQLVYQTVSLGNARDRYGRIRYADSHAWQGRLGARLVKNWEGADGQQYAFWGRANVWHDFRAHAQTAFSSLNGRNAVDLSTRLGSTRVQLGVGVNAQLREALSTFIAVDYEQGLRDSRSRSVSGRIGLQYVW